MAITCHYLDAYFQHGDRLLLTSGQDEVELIFNFEVHPVIDWSKNYIEGDLEESDVQLEIDGFKFFNKLTTINSVRVLKNYETSIAKLNLEEVTLDEIDYSEDIIILKKFYHNGDCENILLKARLNPVMNGFDQGVNFASMNSSFGFPLIFSIDSNKRHPYESFIILGRVPKISI